MAINQQALDEAVLRTCGLAKTIRISQPLLLMLESGRDRDLGEIGHARHHFRQDLPDRPDPVLPDATLPACAGSLKHSAGPVHHKCYWS